MGGLPLPKDVDTEKHGKFGSFIHSIYHRHIEGKKPVLGSPLDRPTTISGYLNLWDESQLSTLKQKKKDKTQVGVGGKYPKKAQLSLPNGTCVRDRVESMAIGSNKEHIIRAKLNHQAWWNQSE